MPDYYMNEAAFDLPSVGFVDQTVTYLEAPVPGSNGGESEDRIALLVERQPLPEGKSLREAASDHINEARTRLGNYMVIFENTREIAETQAVEYAARWRDEQGMVYTRTAHLTRGTTWFIVATEGPLEHRGFCDEMLEHVLSTFRMRV